MAGTANVGARWKNQQFATSVKILIQPSFTNSEGKRRRAIFYTADATYSLSGLEIVEDVKAVDKRTGKAYHNGSLPHQMEIAAKTLSGEGLPDFLKCPKIKLELIFPMYDETIHVLSARQEVINHDQPILDRLMEDNLSVKESWELIQGIESELIRFHAAQDFLHDIFGEGTVDVSSSGRIRLLQNDTAISFPGAETRDNYIYVRLDSLTSPLTQLKRPSPTSPSKEEQQKEAYAKLLRTHAPLSKRVKIRCENLRIGAPSVI